MHIPFTSWAEAHAAFRWSIPPRFNFGRDVVDAWAERHPDRVCLDWLSETGAARSFTWAQMRAASNRLANALTARGVSRGDRVIVQLPRIPEWQMAMVGCLKAGAVPVPCIEMLTAKDIAYRAGHCGAVAAITTAAATGRYADAPRLRARLAVGGAPGWDDFAAALAAASDRLEPVDTAAEDPAVIYYTSGSTGLPKGVTHASRALYAWRVSAWYWQEFAEADLVWCTADTGWSKAGTSILFAPWACGSRIFFYDGRFDPRRRLDLIESRGITVFCGAATEFRHLIAEDLRARNFSKLRLAVSAGELVNPEVVRSWQEQTGVPLIEAYGQTETLMTIANHAREALRPGSMGRALPGTDVDVLDEAHRPVPPGTAGQLAVRLPNPQLMLGYWNEPARTAATRTRHNGSEFFLTGDMAVMDADGYCYYAGRTDDIISSAGYRIGPLEVENALIEHPAVLESAAVAAPDAERGEIVKAFVVLKAGFAPSAGLVRDLQEHVKRTTAPYKYPRAVEFVAELPKTATGKILRRELKVREFARSKEAGE